MAGTGGDEGIAFWDELPIPDANLAIYRQVYSVEQWMRRIAYAALMAKHGASWQGTLDREFASDLKRRLRQLDGRVHLDCENSDNVMWLLTLEELQTMILADANWPAVKETAWACQNEWSRTRLSEIREIRNVIGHNRAVGAGGELLATAAASALRVGIDRFRDQLLYTIGQIHMGDPDEYPHGSVPAPLCRADRQQ